jgi:DNA-binding MarR family transcriptional regulator
VDEIEFAALRDAVEISDSLLSRQVSSLEADGFVRVAKGYVGKRPRTWVSCTASGRAAFDAHVAALQNLIRPTAPNVDDAAGHP